MDLDTIMRVRDLPRAMVTLGVTDLPDPDGTSLSLAQAPAESAQPRTPPASGPSPGP